MAITEINSIGNFDTWDEVRLKEIKKGNFSKAIGKKLYENEDFVLWGIDLKPFERCSFRIHVNNYSCTAFSHGLALSRNVNGQIVLMRFKKGQHFYLECAGNEMITDFENVGEDTLKIAIVEEKVKLEKTIIK